MIHVAAITAGDDRAPRWHEYFGGLRVPVVLPEPQDVIFTNGDRALCYMVDFGLKTKGGDDYRTRLLRTLLRRGGSSAIANMVTDGIYPVIAENVTVITAEESFFPEFVPANEHKS